MSHPSGAEPEAPAKPARAPREPSAPFTRRHRSATRARLPLGARLGPSLALCPARWLSLSLLLSLSLGCAASWRTGEGHYRDARYADALVALQEAEGDFPWFAPDERARYALYRGLAHLAVGDAVRADSWLRFAKHATDRDPAILSVDERGRLSAAWRALGHMPGAGAFGPAWRATEYAP